MELVGLFALMALAAGPDLEARRAVGQNLEPEPAVRTSLHTMIRPGLNRSSPRNSFSGDGGAARRETIASFVAHAHLGFEDGWSASASVPVGSPGGGVVLGNVRLGGGWGRVWGAPNATTRGGFVLGTDVYLPTSLGSEVAGGNLDPEALSTLHAYEPQLFFANSWAVRGRAHGTLEVADLRADAEVAFTAGLGANDRGAGSEWFNVLFEVGYTGWGWVQPFVGTEATVRLSSTNPTVEGNPFQGTANTRNPPLIQSIPPRLNVGASFAHRAFRARVFGQLVIDEEEYGQEVGLVGVSGDVVDVNGEEIPVADGRIDSSSPFSLNDGQGSELHARVGVELGFAFDAL